ncbi:GNAT family N-acetyltransferase [Microvirga soli]|uniref:GNAT family N-acetyltransferase n=1 Tax=Microvirga soli TaxID=1854496 RepID=UPI00191E8E9E|nr:GNAT family N-acetyltransferase [Microvirga soli]
MDIPDLPPDISFERLPHTPEARDFAFEVKRAAMGPHIMVRWGWDEAFQRSFHEQRFRDTPLSQIVHNGQAVGTIALRALVDHLRLDEFYLLPANQGQGLGTRILRHCAAIADARGMPLRLRYLKWNPVGSLYRRHGFREIDETEIHFIMERVNPSV